MTTQAQIDALAASAATLVQTTTEADQDATLVKAGTVGALAQAKALQAAVAQLKADPVVTPPSTPPANTPTVLSFAGAANTPPDPKVWTARQQGNGAGNNEVGFYTTRTSNVCLDGNGNLVLTARREQFSADGYTLPFTTGKVDTQGKLVLPPGTFFEVPMAAPAQPGFDAGVWTQGVAPDGSTVWPATGEADVVETSDDPYNVTDNSHQGTVANPQGDFQWLNYGGIHLGRRVDVSHNYGFYFDANVARWYIDRVLHRQITKDDAAKTGRLWTYGLPQFILLSLAVTRDAKQTFPATATFGPVSYWTHGEPFAVPAVPAGVDPTKPFG
jgi:beta-glucanase (GH16 family)